MLTTESALRKDHTNARGPSLEHRHFAVIAGIINRVRDHSPSSENRADDMARVFASELAATNPRFDRARFLKACGVES